MDNLIKLSNLLHVSIDWLATGEGPIGPGDVPAAPVAIDVDLMGQIMTIFMQAAHDNQTTLPAKDIGNMAARAYQDILRDFPDPAYRQKALAQLTNIAANIARLYK